MNPAPNHIDPPQGKREAPTRPHTSPCPYPSGPPGRIPFRVVAGKMQWWGFGRGKGRRAEVSQI
ncbi:MAG TPA: hypothetical protein VFU49_12690 [Ktedonobacteraceae bacterium]|nr:hypothetical protein [Ktedonobacteraceae bacterium]